MHAKPDLRVVLKWMITGSGSVITAVMRLLPIEISTVNIVHVSEQSFEDEYSASTNAMRDFLYMYFEISGDCRPTGDFDRAELGAVDPFRYLDIDYRSTFQFRSGTEIQFLHQASAVNLLCQLAQVFDHDECSGSTLMTDFISIECRNGQTNHHSGDSLRAHLRDSIPEVFRIRDAVGAGRIIDTPSITNAFTAAFTSAELFHQSLGVVLSDVILVSFYELWP